MSGPIWSRVSPEGNDLVKRMLCFDTDRRITAQQAKAIADKNATDQQPSSRRQHNHKNNDDNSL
jgi:hypothetical protein